MNKYPIHAATNERPVCAALITEILSLGYSIWVWDTEDYAYKGTNKLEILKHMSHAGVDVISIMEPIAVERPIRRGWFTLIYHNGSENEPMVVISDYRANKLCDGIYNKLNEKFSTYA